MKYLAAGLLVATGLLAAVRAAEPGIEWVDLFEAGQGGYAAYRIPGLVATARGTALASCEARRTGRNDWSDSDVVVRRSADGGRTWEPPRQISDRSAAGGRNPLALETKLGLPTEITYSNGAAIAARDGKIHFFYCRDFERCFDRQSSDDGKTFSEPVDITAAFAAFRPAYPRRVIAAGPAHAWGAICTRQKRARSPVLDSNG